MAKLSWKESAAVAFGFFQMAGFNRYQDNVAGKGGDGGEDGGWHRNFVKVPRGNLLFPQK